MYKFSLRVLRDLIGQDREINICTITTTKSIYKAGYKVENYQQCLDLAMAIHKIIPVNHVDYKVETRKM